MGEVCSMHAEDKDAYTAVNNLEKGGHGENMNHRWEDKFKMYLK
jgi:hypothetical protein